MKKAAVPAILITVVLLAVAVIVEAQKPAKVYKVGRLTGGFPADPPNAESFEAFRRGLHDLGWIEGQNIFLEPRWTSDKPGNLRELAADLVRLRVDVIVANGAPMVQAAKEATTLIPIVMAATGADPVEAGFIAGLPDLAGTSQG